MKVIQTCGFVHQTGIFFHTRISVCAGRRQMYYRTPERETLYRVSLYSKDWKA